MKLLQEMLRNKVALVTGGNGGIGEASGRVLASYGAKVIFAGRSLEKLMPIIEEVNQSGGEASPLELDVTDFENIKNKVEEAKNIYGRIDILVNAAGIAGTFGIEEISFESWDKIMNVDLKSVFFISQAVFAVMKEQNYGKMVHIGSLAGQRGGRSADASYAIAKAGCQNLSMGFALAGAEYNITSNIVCPGNILTRMGKDMSWSHLDPRTYIPLMRFGEAEDVAYSVLYYASDLSSYVTGDYTSVNGGIFMD